MDATRPQHTTTNHTSLQNTKRKPTCKHYYYAITEFEDEFCVMKSPKPVCDDECHTVFYGKTMANYKCWPKSETPDEVKSNFPAPGYVKEPVKFDGKYIRSLPVKYSRECSMSK